MSLKTSIVESQGIQVAYNITTRADERGASDVGTVFEMLLESQKVWKALTYATAKAYADVKSTVCRGVNYTVNYQDRYWYEKSIQYNVSIDADVCRGYQLTRTINIRAKASANHSPSLPVIVPANQGGVTFPYTIQIQKDSGSTGFNYAYYDLDGDNALLAQGAKTATSNLSLSQQCIVFAVSVSGGTYGACNMAVFGGTT